MREYRYKENSDIDAYGDTMNVIHFKFGDMRKAYNFTEEFRKEHPRFVEEYEKYWKYEDSLFSDPLTLVNYVEMFNIPVRLYSNFVDQEFADTEAAKEWVCNEYMGHRQELYKWDVNGYIGLDGEKSV